MKGLVLGVLSILLLSSFSAAQTAFGSTSDLSSIQLAPGAYGKFTASFFNMGEGPLDVSFQVEYPSDLRIEVDPPQLSMYDGVVDKPDSSGSWLILDGGRRFVKSYPVSVYVKVPSQISSNTYRIKLIATARGRQDASGSGFAQDLVQVRELLFVANVPGRVNNEASSVVRIDASSGDVIKSDAEESFASGGGYSQPSGGSSGGGDSGQGTSVASTIPSAQKQSSSQSGFGVSKDTSGNTNINLPTGKVTVSPEQANFAVDLGLVTLLLSIGSLVVRILK